MSKFKVAHYGRLLIWGLVKATELRAISAYRYLFQIALAAEVFPSALKIY
jgi:hypothetical protein